MGISVLNAELATIWTLLLILRVIIAMHVQILVPPAMQMRIVRNVIQAVTGIGVNHIVHCAARMMSVTRL